MAGLIKRGEIFYAVYYLGGRQKRISLDTSSKQIAKDKVRQLESALVREQDLPFPTKTPIGKVVQAYVEYMQIAKTKTSRMRSQRGGGNR